LSPQVTYYMLTLRHFPKLILKTLSQVNHILELIGNKGTLLIGFN